MKQSNKNHTFSTSSMWAIRIIAALFFVVLFYVLLIGQGYSTWYFSQFSVNSSTAVNVAADPLNYASDQIVNIDDETQKKYDVYFLAQHIDIHDFIEIDDRVNAMEQYRFIDRTNPSHSLFYTNSEQEIPGYEPRLGTWDPNFSTDFTVASNLFKKFENVSSLTTEEIDSVGAPYSKMVDSGSSGWSGYWNLEFLDWTLDSIKLNYDAVIATDDVHGNPIIDPETNLPQVATITKSEVEISLDAITNVSIYHRETWHSKNIGGNIQVYGTFPTEGFEIAHSGTIFEAYDKYAININGRKCLFFYPIYSLGKDQINNSRLYRNAAANRIKNADILEDCLRAEDGRTSSLADYATFDEDYTNLLQTNPLTTDRKEYWPDEGWPKDITEYRCFRLSNRYVTQEMVERNSTAKEKATTLVNGGTIEGYELQPTNANFNLDQLQYNQTYFGEYMYVDIHRGTDAWDGKKIGYLVDTDNNLADINFKQGLFNVYVFVKQTFIDDPAEARKANRTANFAFAPEECAAIDELFNNRGINVVKTINCLSYTNFIMGRWNKNDARGFYVVLEEVINLENTSNYGQNEHGNFIYSAVKNVGLTNSYISPSGIEFDLEATPVEVSSDSALLIDGTPVTFTYPNYYFTNVVEGEANQTYTQNIGYGNNSTTYSPPTFNCIFSNGERIRKTFKSTEHLETIYQAILREPEEENRLKVTIDSQTYTLAQLKETQNEIYLDIVSQLQSVGLIKVKKSGNYRLAVVISSTDGQMSFDAWAVTNDGYVVSIYDPADFGDAEFERDVNGVLISKNAMLSTYSYICEMSYVQGENLLTGKNTGAEEYVVFKLFDDKLIPADMQEYITQTHGINHINIFDLIAYYDQKGMCLYDIASGRHITLANIQSYPFIINKDCILIVKLKPATIN